MSVVAAATLALTVPVFVIVWRISIARQDAGIVDILWGPGFLLIAAAELAFAPAFTLPVAVLVALVALWSIRLAHYLAARSRRAGREDSRYRALRKAGGAGFERRSLYSIFLLQAVLQWALALPIHIGLLAARADWSGPLLALGALLFAAGFAIEVAADQALDRFRSNPANEGKLLTTGLFAWSRHPNHFGEALLWVGLAMIAQASSGSWLPYLSPIALGAIMLRLSAVAPIDRRLARTRPGYAEWARRTSAFVPWPPKGG